MTLRRKATFVAVRLAGAFAIFAVTLCAFDAIYTLGILGAWRANYWLTRAHIPIRYSAADAELGFVRKPGVIWYSRQPASGERVEYRTDANGFRNSAPVEKADVVFIGDSYTEAAQVPESETFVKLFEKQTGLRTVNLGRGAYGPQQELAVLKRYGLPLQPKIVVWQLFAGNDVADAVEFERWRTNAPGTEVSLARKYFSNSLIRFGVKRVLGHGEGVGVGVPISFAESNGPARSIRLLYAFEPYSAREPEPGMRLVLDTLAQGARLCRERGVQLVVTVVPTMMHALEPAIAFRNEADRSRYAPRLTDATTDFETRVANHCRALGIAYVDLLGALRTAGAHDNRRLFLFNDEHFDVEGHQVVATALINHVRPAAATVRAGL